MTSSDLAALREVFLSAPIPLSTRILALWISLSLLIVVLWLVKRRLLREQYTPIWVVAASGLMFLNIWPRPLFAMTRALGAWTHGSTLFYLGLLFVVAICLSYAVRLSSLTLQVKNLAQEISLLRARLEEDHSASREPSRVKSPT
jgi:hypothetical protein